MVNEYERVGELCLPAIPITPVPSVSWKKNGGVLTGNAVSPRSGKPILHYWIELNR